MSFNNTLGPKPMKICKLSSVSPNPGKRKIMFNLDSILPLISPGILPAILILYQAEDHWRKIEQNQAQNQHSSDTGDSEDIMHTSL